MKEERYRRRGGATLSRSMFKGTPHAPIDVIAIALCVALDALACDDIAVDARLDAEPARRWAFDREHDSATTIAQLLERGARPVDATTPTATVSWIEDPDTPTDDADAIVSVVARQSGEDVELEVTDSGLDRDVTPEALARLLARLVQEIVDDADRTPSSVPLVSVEQRDWLVDGLNDVWMPYPDAPTVDELVLEVATRTPDAVAIDDGRVRVTYAELVERAHAVADLLGEAGARPGEAVALKFARGVDCVVSMLGVLLARAVYVPIAMDEPDARRERLLDLFSVRLMLDADLAGGVRITTRTVEGRQLLGDDPDDRGGAPLYVMFTSGSTGEPKAVVVSHRAVIRLVLDPAFVGFTAEDAVGFASNPGFDAATWEVWGALVNGGRLIPIDVDTVLDPRALEARIESGRVSCLFLTTSLFNVHARSAPTVFRSLRILAIGGEAADPTACRLVLESSAPPRALLNAYGPTESTTFASWHHITDAPEGTLRLPIGLPVVNTTLHVLDRYGRLVPPGVPGELFIGGDGLALGYLDDADLTARKFVPDPFAGPPHRLYATGDLVVRETSGEIVFLRRMDDQLKIRGFRVEPLEIEAAIRSIDGVSTAVVLPRIVDGRPRLIAYVVADSSRLDAAAIRSQLRAELPTYLVPSRVVLVDDLPLTRSGKLDRARLPDPFASSSAIDDVAIVDGIVDDEVAAAVVDIWREVLGVREVDPEQTFFDAGGDSLLAVRLYGAVQRRFGVVLPTGAIDDQFTVGRFVEAVRLALGGAAPPLVTEMTSVDGPLIVLAAPGGGEVDRYRWLASALTDAYHVVALREPGYYGTEPRPRTMTDLAFTSRRALREGGFDAPVAIVGECSGGVVAHQLACDLARAGHRVDLVVLLDTPVPGEANVDDETDAVIQAMSTVRRRGRNAVALTKMQAQWMWYQRKKQLPPGPLAHRMTVRANARRLRGAVPSFFDGHVLYVQAVDDAGATETEGAPEYWSQRARSNTVVTVPGSHVGTESFLSRANVGVTADAIIRELEAVREASTE